MERIKLNHPRFGVCWLNSIDAETYSIPMATVYCDKLDEVVCRSLVEFDGFKQSTEKP